MTTPQVGDIWQWSDNEGHDTEYLVLLELVEEFSSMPHGEHKIYDYKTFNLTREKFEDVIINMGYMPYWSLVA